MSEDIEDFFEGHDPLSNSFFEYFSLKTHFVFINELKYLQSIMKKNWNKSSINMAIAILSQLLNQLQNSSKGQNVEQTENSCLLNVIQAISSKLELVPIEKIIPIELERDTITTSTMDKILKLIAHDFCALAKGSGLEDKRIADFYGIIFLISIWKIKDINCSNYQGIYNLCFWTKNATLAYEVFDHVERWSLTTLHSEITNFKSADKQTSYNESLTSNTLCLLAKEDWSRRKGAHKSYDKNMRKLYEEAKQYYCEHKCGYIDKPKTQFAQAIRAHLVKQGLEFKKNRQNNEDHEKDRRTVLGWINDWNKGVNKEYEEPFITTAAKRTNFINEEFKKLINK